MYKYKSGQISITDFGQPMGMHLNENNRWVKKAAMIPWGEIEKRYAGLFKSHKGNPAKPLPDRKQNYIDECERVEVERRFSLAKHKCNLGRVTAKLTDTAFHCIAMSIVVLNLRKLMLSLPQFLKQHFLYFGFFEFSFIQ